MQNNSLPRSIGNIQVDQDKRMKIILQTLIAFTASFTIASSQIILPSTHVFLNHLREFKSIVQSIMSDVTTATCQSNIRKALDASKHISDLSYIIGDYLHFIHNIRMRAILKNQETPSREELEELRKLLYPIPSPPSPPSSLSPPLHSLLCPSDFSSDILTSSHLVTVPYYAHHLVISTASIASASHQRHIISAPLPHSLPPLHQSLHQVLQPQP